MNTGHRLILGVTGWTASTLHFLGEHAATLAGCSTALFMLVSTLEKLGLLARFRRKSKPNE